MRLARSDEPGVGFSQRIVKQIISIEASIDGFNLALNIGCVAQKRSLEYSVSSY
jgi:hypothetical protein